MRTKTRILTTAAVGALVAGAFAAGAAADTSDGDADRARNAMHAQMGGDMGVGMMSDDTWESMQAMHDAIDPAAMQQMHDQMVDLIPADLRDDAEEMHGQMFPAMNDASDVDHGSHHPTG